MSIKLTFFILPIIFFAYVNSEPNNEQSNEKSVWLDTNEFGDLIPRIRAVTDLKDREDFKKLLKGFQDKAFSKGLATGISTGIATGERNMKGSHMFVHFECFVTFVKHDCEVLYNYFKDRDFKNSAINEFINNQKINLPDFIKDLYETNDKWMYEGFKFPETTAEATTSAKQKKEKTIIPKLVTYFKQWYYILTVELDKLSPMCLCILQSELQRFFLVYEQKYVKYEKFLEIFAGHIARSYIQACSLHHNGTSAIRNYRTTDPKKPFHKILLDVIPSWYMNDEQFAFLQLFHTAMTIMRDKTLQYEKYVIRNKWTTLPVQSSHSGWIVIPYYDARECNAVNLDEYATNIIPNEVYYTRPQDGIIRIPYD